jgi:hypothetical protein
MLFLHKRTRDVLVGREGVSQALLVIAPPFIDYCRASAVIGGVSIHIHADLPGALAGPIG